MKQKKVFWALIILVSLVAVGTSIWWNIATTPKKSRATLGPVNLVCRCQCDGQSGIGNLCYEKWFQLPDGKWACNDFNFDSPATSTTDCSKLNGTACTGYVPVPELGIYPGKLADCTLTAISSQ